MKKTLLSLGLSCFVLLSSPLHATKNDNLMLRNGRVTVDAENPLTPLKALEASIASKYLILQFNEVPTNAEKQVLAQHGVNLLEYVPKNAFIATLNNPGNVSIKELNIRGAVPFLTEYKYSTSFTAQENPVHAINGDLLDLIIETHLDVSQQELLDKLITLNIEVLSSSSNGEYAEIRINRKKVTELANEAIIKSIDYIPSPPEKEDQLARVLHRGNMLDSEHPLGRKYDGSGVSIAIADDAIIGPHIDIAGRVTSFSSNQNGTHGDMTTGIAMGAGNLNPDYRGMATGAYLYYYDIGGYPHISGAVANLNNNGVVITSTSFSEGCNAGYTTTTREADQQTRQNTSLLHVFSAGNSASSTCGNNAYGAGTPWGTITGGRKQGKATIATGNLTYNDGLTASSSRGPAADGRIKPDICANGTNQISTNANNTYQVGGGTSAAAPGIAGLAAQMYQGYRELNGGANPESGLIKAAMLNTAQDLGNRGPDFTYGWGRVNAHRAMKLIEENRYTDSTISQGNLNTHNVTIGNNIEALQFMIYWTDYEGSTTASQALVNNLDLQVVTPAGDTIAPWVLNSAANAASLSSLATRGTDDLNNMEQVSIDSVIAGTYTVLVDGKTIPQGPQKYFILWETRTDSIEVTYPSGGEGFTPGTVESIKWDAITTGSAIVEYSVDNGANWILIGVNTNPSISYRDWFVPDSVTGDALVRVTVGSLSGQSANTFSIINTPQNIRTSFACPDSIGIAWDTVPGATEYEIYLMGSTHMDSVGRSSTTNFTIQNINLSDDNWVSVKALGNGIAGKRAVAVLLSKSVDLCYDLDLDVVDIISPASGTILNCGSTTTSVEVLVNNSGRDTLSNIPVQLRYGNNILYDTIAGPIPSNVSDTFSFSSTIDVSSLSTVNLTVKASLLGDANSDNDSTSRSYDVLNTLEMLPYYEDFESFNSCATTNNCGATICPLSNGWTNSEDDDHDLRVDAGGTPSNNTGPNVDHNPGTSSGKYIYSEASGGCTFQNSIVTSPCFDLTNAISPEFKFWYHMDGNSVGSIRVDVFANGVWNLNATPAFGGSQGSAWLEKTIDMSSYAGQIVNIRFQVLTGNSWQSDIAIDDISFVDQTTGIDDKQLSTKQFSVYPNPTSGIFTINFDEIPSQRVQILDVSGRVIESLRISSTSENVDLSSYTKGVYFISVEDSGIREKLVIY